MAVPDLNFVLNFLDQVKGAFAYKPKKYRRLQLLWQSYLKKDIDYFTLLNRLSGLLSDDPVLVSTFNELLPSEFKITLEKSEEDEHDLKRSRTESKTSYEPQIKRFKYVDCPDEESYSMYGTWDEFSFFDKVKTLLGNECTYLNFMKCIELFNKNLIDSIELIEILQPFIGKSPSMMTQLKSMLHHHLKSGCNWKSTRKGHKRNATSLAEEIKEYEIDFSSCRKMGSSYRALKVQPDNKPMCSGRTDLCKQVLNDIWVSFPLWSEDPATTSESQGGCKITSIQEFFYKCEDERFELDIVIDQLSSTIRTLEEVQNSMNSMSQEEVMAFQLDDSLGGSSQVLQRKVIERIYGDKAKDLLEGLKLKPFIGVPIALRRLKAKQQEWMEHRIKFNKIWKENTEKHSQRALNCELASVRQNDHKDARTKVIVNEVEALHEESLVLSSIYGKNCPMKGKHFVYSDKEIFNDLNDLIDFNLHCLSECWPEDGTNNGAFATISGSTPTAAASLSTDKMILSFCKKVLQFFRILNDGNDAGSTPFMPNRICDAFLPESSADASARNGNDSINGHHDRINSLVENEASENSDASSGSSQRVSNFPDEMVMYQTSRWLVALSLHHKIYSRLSKIRAVSERELLDRDRLDRACDRKKSKAVYHLDINGKEECDSLYSFAITVLRKSCLRGTCESGIYEEHIRKTMAKVKNESSFNYNDVSYWMISLDKLLKNIIRELQQLAADETTRKGMELFEMFHFKVHKSISTSHMTYRHKSLNLFSRDFCYKFTFKKKWNKIVVELIDLTNGECSKEAANKINKLQIWQEYIYNYITSEADQVQSLPFMMRNLRKEVPTGLMISGSDQFAFQPNSFKLTFSSSSHSVLHRIGRICTFDENLKSQTIHRCNKFFQLWGKWQSLNVTSFHDQKFSDWMLGMKKNQTRIFEMSDLHSPPYRTYKKYLTVHRP